MKLMMFGASGCLGTNVETACAARGYNFVGPSHETIDVCDADATRAFILDEKPDAVINGVAIVGINPCEEDPATAFKVHATVTRDMAKACAEAGAVHVMTSSHAVFDGLKSKPYVESDETLAGSIYAISKIAGEQLAATWCPAHYVVRFPTMYGSRRNNAPGFVDKMLGMMRDGREPTVAADKIDSPTYMRDAADRLIRLIKEGEPFGTYHIANEGIVSYHTFVERLAGLAGLEITVHAGKDSDFPALAPKPLYTAMRSEKIGTMRRWDEALADYVATELTDTA